MSSPYAKSKQRLEKIGYRVGKCEHWNHFAKIRQDLYGCIDLIAMRPGEALLAVQPTDITSVSKRMAKAHQTAIDWVSTGNRFEVHGWTAKSKKPPRVMAMRQDGSWWDVNKIEE